MSLTAFPAFRSRVGPDMPTFDDHSVSAASSDDAAMEMGSSKFLRTQLSETNMDDILRSHSARLGSNLKAPGTSVGSGGGAAGAGGKASRRTSADLIDAPDMGGDAIVDEEQGSTRAEADDDESSRYRRSSSGVGPSSDASVVQSEADLSMACPRASAAIVIEDILDGSDRAAPDGFMGWAPRPPSPQSTLRELPNRLDGSTSRRGSLRFDKLWDDGSRGGEENGANDGRSNAGSSETKSSMFFGKRNGVEGKELARGAGGGGGRPRPPRLVPVVRARERQEGEHMLSAAGRRGRDGGDAGEHGANVDCRK